MAVELIGDGVKLSGKGDILSHDGTSFVSIPVGTSGQILSYQSSAGVVWQSPTTTPIDYHEAIAYSEITAATNTVSFDSIPSGYTNLELRFTSRCTRDTSARQPIYFKINSSSSSVWRWKGVSTSTGQDSLTAENQTTVLPYALIGYSSVTQDNQSAAFARHILTIYQYSSSAVNKAITCTSGISGTGFGLNTYSYWTAQNTVTDSVTSIQLYYELGGFAAGCTFSLYGIKRLGQ
jgi:hypothetical protein